MGVFVLSVVQVYSGDGFAIASVRFRAMLAM